MKGVIVQVGDPKSIVLFNNGKIQAIPTPPDCHMGMVVTVKNNNAIKIIIITSIAVLLLALGIFIGARYWGTDHPPVEKPWQGGHGHGYMMERGR
ncbi:MAG: hypothetical protein LBC64_07360 [Fibromonadaceae bacterium]|jgi:hypothetical protein|nr:hypothetical protein [Fibromonadaceae bacterium]